MNAFNALSIQALDEQFTERFGHLQTALTGQEQDVLAALGLFPEGLTTHEAVTLLGISSGAFTRIITTLRRCQVPVETTWVKAGRDKAARLGQGAHRARLYRILPLTI